MNLRAMKSKVSPGTIRLGALLGVLLLGYGGYTVMYARPMADAQDRLASVTDAVEALEDRLRDRRAVQRDLREFAQSTLGQKRDEVDHRFSAGLRTLAERSGLSRVVVTRREPVKMANPITRMGQLQPASIKRPLRNAPDFYVLGGTLTGTGTLESVLRAMAEIDAQPWCRVDGFALRPASKKDDTMTVELDIVAPWAPDLLKSELSDPTLVKAPPEAEFSLRAIVARNAFREESKAVAAATPQVVTPAPANPAPPAAEPPPVLPPPPPPYAEWKLTGVVQGRSTGLQAMFSNTRTNQNVTVLKGAKVEDATLVDGSGETAVFEIGGQLFRVRIHQTLADRTPLG